MAFADLMGRTITSTPAFAQASAGQDAALHPLAPRKPHFAAKAKRMIHIFPNGGASHVDSFDPKPSLEKYKGKPLPFENYKTERKTGAAYPSPFTFKKHGQSGLEISTLFPKLAEFADDLCVVHSMYTELPN